MSRRIDPRLPLGSEVRRIAMAEIDSALAHLAAAQDDPDTALHECRKQLKSLRALLRLVRSGDEAFFRAENARYREISAQLAGPREATALIETLDRLEKAFPDEAAGGALGPVRAWLVARHDSVLNSDLTRAVEAAVVDCRAGLQQVERFILPDDPERTADILADGVRKVTRRGVKAFRHAKARGKPGDFHQLRKALKASSKHLSLLKECWPSPVKAQRKAVDSLAEKLGELHDVFVLRALLREGKPLGGYEETRLLVRLAKRSERKLRKICLADAQRLFPDSPRQSAKKVAGSVRHGMAEARPAA
jgi:CHAD domain-containing protein